MQYQESPSRASGKRAALVVHRIYSQVALGDANIHVDAVVP